jgi:hypothetical protein
MTLAVIQRCVIASERTPAPMLLRVQRAKQSPCKRVIRRRAFFPTTAKRAVQAISLTLENAVNRGLLQSLRSFAMTFSDNVRALSVWWGGARIFTKHENPDMLSPNAKNIEVLGVFAERRCSLRPIRYLHGLPALHIDGWPWVGKGRSSGGLSAWRFIHPPDGAVCGIHPGGAVRP